MKKMTALAASILVVIASGQAMAAGSSVNMQVSGKLVPSACEISTGGTGVTFGDIDVGLLNKDKATELKDKAKKIDITVTCPSATLTGIKFSDLAGGKDSTAFTLGKKGNVELGSYQVRLDPKASQVDGKPPVSFAYRNESGLFVGSNGITEVVMSNGSVTKTAGFDISSTEKGHAAATTKLFSMTVTPTINATNAIGNVQEAELTGIASVDIIYL
ncbi:DUF1120 domain-containing protein [Erwinia aphidicola]|uniref:DUF1120 domain-containing protein n=1 Tax=Erwinia aphidicola TaxID=68334 RepID=UPI00300C4956